MPHRPEQYGTECRIWQDRGPGETVEPGDVMRSEAGACYLVLEARRVRSTIAPNRWHARCLRLDPEDVTDDDHVLEFYWYPRRRSA